MDLCCAQLADGLTALCGKNFDFGHYANIQPNSFILAMLIDTIDFYQFTPLSLILTMAGGFKISAKWALLA